MKPDYPMEATMPETDMQAEAAPVTTPSFKDTRAYGITHKDGRTYGFSPEQIAAALTGFSTLSPRVQVSQPTPELALVDMAKHVIDQSRMLTEALTTVKSTGHASEERLAALEVTLAGLVAKIDALQAAPAPAAKSKEDTATAKAPPATPKKGAAKTESDDVVEQLAEPVDSVDDYEEITEPEKPAPKTSRSGKPRVRDWL